MSTDWMVGQKRKVKKLVGWLALDDNYYMIIFQHPLFKDKKENVGS